MMKLKRKAETYKASLIYTTLSSLAEWTGHSSRCIAAQLTSFFMPYRIQSNAKIKYLNSLNCNGFLLSP